MAASVLSVISSNFTPVVFTDLQKNRFLHCLLCKQVYTIPVILISCGHTYCRHCIVSPTPGHNEDGFHREEPVFDEAGSGTNGKTGGMMAMFNQSEGKSEVRCPVDGSLCVIDKLVVNR